MTASTGACLRCGRPLTEGLFCQYDGTFVLDPEGTVVMASRGERLLSWLVSGLIFVLTLGIGWVIWWFIVAPRGQNPGKAIVGLRVIRTDGDAVRTGGMLVRGLAGFAAGLLPFFLDELWILWDRDAQTIHDKIVNTVVVKAKGSEKIVEQGGLGTVREGVPLPHTYAPPITIPRSTPPAETPEATLTRLAEMRARDLISEEEYQAKRTEILGRI
jgi:uncharacterized RDD family membrane protein YckC